MLPVDTKGITTKMGGVLSLTPDSAGSNLRCSDMRKDSLASLELDVRVSIAVEVEVVVDASPQFFHGGDASKPGLEFKPGL